MTDQEFLDAVDELKRELELLMAGIDPSTGDRIFPGRRPPDPPTV